MTPPIVWLDKEGKGEQKVPQGKGERSIICHIGAKAGSWREQSSFFAAERH